MVDTETVIHVIQGQHRVSDRPGDILATVLGSCIAVCLHDPLRRIGGINHFLLPGAGPAEGTNVKYGAHAMETLVNAMLRAGAARERLVAQIYGGANIFAGLGRIGDANAAFAQDYVRCEGFSLQAADTGGHLGRRLRFRPALGIAQVQDIDPDLPELRRSETTACAPPSPATRVELF